MNIDRKILIIGFIMTIVNYLVSFFFSSREILLDSKNLCLVFVCSMCWAYLVVREKNKGAVWGIYFSSLALGFFVPMLALLEEPFYMRRLMKDFLFWYSLPLLFIAFSAIKSRYNFLKPVLAVGSVVYFIIAFIPLLIISMYYVTFSSLISVDSVMAVLHTNIQESIEFLSSYISVSSIIILGVLFVGLLFVCRKMYSIICCYDFVTFSSKAQKIIFLVLTLFLMISNIDFFSKMYWSRTFDQAINREKMLVYFEKESEVRYGKLAKDKALLQGAQKGIYALIIGETHSRSNVSAFGYQRETTPWLKSAVKDGKVILLENGFSNSAQTSPALSYALTSKNQYNKVQVEDAYTICEIAKASGFEVIWVSNQIDNNIVGRIGHEADKQYWLNKKHNDTWLRQKNSVFDANVIECLKSLKITSDKTLIIINLLGSHASYDCRYPEEFKKWEDKDNIVNAYDNSILYNDYVMQEVHRILFDKLNADAMIYFADHGEELKIKFCHGNEFFRNNYKKYDSVKEIVKIPIYLAFSKGYADRHPEIVRGLVKNHRAYFTNDMIYDTMLGVMQIKSPYYDARFDITSKDYKLQLDDLRTLHGEVALKDCL